LTSLSSQAADENRQGTVLGVLQSLSALARMLGAAWGGWVFGTFTPATPFVMNSLLMSLAVAFAIVFMIMKPTRPTARPEAETGVTA
jgi:predicted MFS family arabinose efflux permease